MNLQTLNVSSRTALLLSAAIATTVLSGCVYANPDRPNVYQGRPSQVVVMQDDYMYYPQYEVYYSNTRHQYGYRDGNAWVWRPAPPRVALNVLRASPSVHMDFHDAPERHHAAVVKAYPRNWRQTSPKRGDHDNDHQH
ncbi:MAG: hypothetical protein ABI222_17965 [Opitutaceae bacterium]